MIDQAGEQRPHRAEARARSFAVGPTDRAAIDERQRQEGQPGVDRAVAEHALEVQAPRKNAENIPMHEQAAHDARARQPAQAQDAQRHDRVLHARLEREERGEQRTSAPPPKPSVCADAQP